MITYTVLKLIYDYVNDNNQTENLLFKTSIFVIPIVNYDGFEAIGQNFQKTGSLEWIRKNRHIYEGMENCDDEYKGVDLNRNYPFKFGYDNEGSSGSYNMCQEDYRGPKAASEPEV